MVYPRRPEKPAALALALFGRGTPAPAPSPAFALARETVRSPAPAANPALASAARREEESRRQEIMERRLKELAESRLKELEEKRVQVIFIKMLCVVNFLLSSVEKNITFIKRGSETTIPNKLKSFIFCNSKIYLY